MEKYPLKQLFERFKKESLKNLPNEEAKDLFIKKFLYALIRS